MPGTPRGPLAGVGIGKRAVGLVASYSYEEML